MTYDNEESLQLLEAPTKSPVDLDEVKSFMRVTHNKEDALIEGILRGSIDHCESLTNRKFITQKWRYFLDTFPCDSEICMPFPPLQSVQSVKYYDEGGILQTLASNQYVVDASRIPGRIALAPGVYVWPITQLKLIKSVQIDFTCGYLNPAAVPIPIKEGIQLLTCHLYDNRDLNDPPKMIDFILYPYKVFSFR